MSSEVQTFRERPKSKSIGGSLEDREHGHESAIFAPKLRALEISHGPQWRLGHRAY